MAFASAHSARSYIPSRLCSSFIIFRVLFILAISVILLGTAWLWQRRPASAGAPLITAHHDHRPESQQKEHPIGVLMKRAETEWHELMSRQTEDLASAARAYRKRRGRHPPPGFDRWFQFAQKHDAVMIEDFFDQIYDDLNPFWGVEAKKIRQQAKTSDFVISVRNGTTAVKTDKRDRPWMVHWPNLVKTLQDLLPDVDVPVNVMDESRLIVPWEDINEYVRAERESRKIVPKPEVVREFSGLSDVDKDPGEPFDPQWIHGQPFWDVARVGCAPGTPARNLSAATDFKGPPPMPSGFPKGSYEGYVQNWTQVKDPCLDPSIRESHGTFIEPISMSTSRSLIPLFGGSKLPMNNEILIPPAMYWAQNPRYSGKKDYHGPEWEEKQTKVVWRGAASGGRNKADTWTRFQRHRFLSMINGTEVQLAEKNPENAGQGPNFILQSYTSYHLTATQYTDLGSWLSELTDCMFMHLICFPDKDPPGCAYNSDHYQTTQKNMPMSKMYDYKYLPDLDGNSFSGRYRGFLKSTSLPIKATIYAEWHDPRLVPWLHFVPMHNSFVDIYGILDYFIGINKVNEKGEVVNVGGHDDAAKKIALAGKEWAEKVHRREDMQIYMFRLLLEYARICDDKRNKLGFIGDLK